MDLGKHSEGALRGPMGMSWAVTKAPIHAAQAHVILNTNCASG